MPPTQTADYSSQLLPPVWCATAHPPGHELKIQISTGFHLAEPRGRFRSALIEVINSAKEVILICAFLFTDDEIEQALTRAADRGVRVYMLTASEVRLQKVIRDETGFDQKMAKEHAAMLDRLAGRVLVRTADHFHAKFLITDPRTASPRGWISTANFNPALIQNLEFGCTMTPEAIRTIAAFFNRAFWCESSKELREKGKLSAIAPAPLAPDIPVCDIAWANLKNSPHLNEACIRLIDSAKIRLCLSAFSIEQAHPVSTALVHAAKRGVHVRLFLRPGPTGAETLVHLSRSGIEIYGDDRLHAKAILADETAIVMTCNPTHAATPAFDVGTRCDAAQCNALQSVFNHWASSFQWRFRHNAKLGDRLGEIRSADGKEYGAVPAATSRNHGMHKSAPELPPQAPGPKYARKADCGKETKPHNTIAVLKTAAPSESRTSNTPRDNSMVKKTAPTPPAPFGSLGDKFGKK